ncbi:MAG: DUF1638 domain-containing protein [Spirochaetaceae bacterium]|jgi:hypothetical protein|nr:DUF1638 domain-containing protein [Spirochaetaceae bacterium]
MNLPIISCGIFKWELESILPYLEKELKKEISVKYLEPSLDVSETKLENAIKEGFSFFSNQKPALLYGCMCHPKMKDIAKNNDAVPAKVSNCVEFLLGSEKKKELDKQGDFYYLTAGGLRLWKEIYKQGHGWDDVDARINFGRFDKIIVLDSGLFEISDEALFEFFDFVQVPVEIEKISLDHFKSQVLEICRGAI